MIGTRTRAALRCVPPLLLSAFLVAGSARAASRLVCRRGGDPSPSASKVRAAKVFPDEVARVGAIDKARARGSFRGDRTTVRLLAIRVEFQTDDDPRSTGDGRFDYSPFTPQTFDSPPHDREYFELHMTSLANYYRSVSHGLLEIEFEVAPADSRSAYVLPYEMGYYHDYSEDQFWYVDQVERFTRDAFAAADTTDTLDFSRFDGYILFHAGADWQSDVNYDTPFDLPSAHISLGDSIAVNDGEWAIWDAAIMPETSRQDGLTFLLNGTLAHEVGHILGLPDLYNTANFFPAIGSWGIMDSGGSIGMDTPWGWAYGALPVPPCAWSLEFMGWADPVVLLEGADDLEVKASVLRGPGQRLYKIPVTSDEYFLIENRLDDIENDGIALIEQERGVVLGPVDPGCTQEVCPVNHEYDYLIPGPGMLIYHIDNTRVIPGLLPFDTVNNDRRRRGVAVEEADGIMDLGDFQSFYWTGSPYDAFYEGNNSTFAWDTFPSTDDNLGGATFLSISGISVADTVMVFDVAFDRWKEGWPIETGEPIGGASPRVVDLDGDGVEEILVASLTGAVFAWHVDGTPVITGRGNGPPGFFASASGGVRETPAVADLDRDGDMEVIVAAESGSLYVYSHVDGDGDGAADPHSTLYPVALGGAASGPPLAADMSEAFGLEIAVAAEGGDLTVLDANGRHVAGSPYAFGHLVLDDVTLAAGDLDGDGLSELVASTTNRGWIVALRADGTALPNWPIEIDGWSGETVSVALGDVDRAVAGGLEIVAAGSDGWVHVWDASGSELAGWPVRVDGPVVSRPALADLDGDGLLEIVLAAGGSTVTALRWNGLAADNWPVFADPGDSARPMPGSPVLGDLDGDGACEVVVAGSGGRLFAWGGASGERLPGWPLSADPSVGTPWLGDADADSLIDAVVAGSSGRVSFYGLPYLYEPGAIVWPTDGGNPAGSGAYPDSLLPDAPEVVPGLLEPEGTYCYPNPARRSDLTIRIALEEPAELDVEIFDVSGQLIERIRADGVPTVNEVVWRTDGAASGLYIVRVEASAGGAGGLGAAGGRSEAKLMKVAVLR